MATPVSASHHSPGRPVLRLRRDRALRSLVAKGDPRAFAELYERHHQALYRYCRSIVHHDEDARDALHNTMTRAFAALATEERDFELKPWLFRIAHNEAVSILRKRRDTRELDAETDMAATSLEHQVADREGIALLRVDLADLPERQRAALALRELNGLSHVEIATVLEMTPSAVKQAIFDARSALLEFREGRDMDCAGVQRSLSDGDGRVLRARKMRAHLRSCRGCRQFREDLVRRPAAMAVLAPPLPPAASAALLAHVLSAAKTAGITGGQTVGAAGLTAGAGKATGAAGLAGAKAAGVAGVSSVASGAGAAGTLGAKLALAALVVTAGGGSAAVIHKLDRPIPMRPPATAPAPRRPAGSFGPTVRPAHALPPSASGQPTSRDQPRTTTRPDTIARGRRRLPASARPHHAAPPTAGRGRPGTGQAAGQPRKGTPHHKQSTHQPSRPEATRPRQDSTTGRAPQRPRVSPAKPPASNTSPAARQRSPAPITPPRPEPNNPAPQTPPPAKQHGVGGGPEISGQIVPDSGVRGALPK